MGENVAVIGAGSWGSALATLLAANGHDVRIWSRGTEVAELINQQHENKVYLPGFALHPQLTATTSLEDALTGRSFVVMVVPSHAMRTVLEQAGSHIGADAAVVSASKGIEDGSSKTMFEVILDCIGGADRIGVLSGPSFAAEVAGGQPTVVVAAARQMELAERVQRTFAGATFRVYSSTDVVGVEIGGVVKNIMAIATGVSDGLEYGLNARAALITRGLAEISRLAAALGGRPETLAGLSGIGDLVLTCTGDLSRNRQFGLRIGRGETVAEILGSMRMVAEGVRNTKAVRELASRLAIELPIVEVSYQVLYQDLPPREALGRLFSRSLKPEFH